MPLEYFRHSRWVIVVLALLLSACTPSTMTARPTPSLAVSPTGSLPSSTALPFPSPAATTAIPTPPTTPGPAAYRLKPWTEQDAFDAILRGEKLDPAADAQLLRDTQEYLFTLDREALLRFPDGKNNNELEWKYARESAILEGFAFPEGAPGGGFVRLLGKALDSGQLKPDMLEAWLPNKGFDVVSQHSAPNLFGDGEPAQVLQIETQDRLRPGEILLAIAKSPQAGSYRLFPVRPYWLIRDSRQPLEEVAIVSQIANDRTEIQTVTEYAFPTICYSQLRLFQWRLDGLTSAFENVAGDVIVVDGDYRNSECRDPWEFGERDARGARPLIVTLRHKNWAGKECSEYEFKIRYEWDGTAYRRLTGGASLPDKSQLGQCFIGWAHAAAKHGLYDQAIPLVVSALPDWPKELDAVWGPSSKDLFRFELGIWYIFQGNDQEGLSALQDVEDHPANAAFSMVPRMAETFLSRYQVIKDPDRSCVDVYNMLKQEFQQTPDNGGFASSGRTIPAWGFAEPDWLSRMPALEEVCDHGWRPDIPWSVQFPQPGPESVPLVPMPTVSPIPEDTQEMEIQRIERMLFFDGDSQQASQLIEQLLGAGVIEPDYGERIKPYLRYLLGLAYELSGDEGNAVDNYWRVWHDYPDSLYSNIVQYKIERITP